MALSKNGEFASKGRDPNIFETRREPLELGKKNQHFQVQNCSKAIVESCFWQWRPNKKPSEFKVLRLLPACREHLAAAARAAQAYFRPFFWKGLDVEKKRFQDFGQNHQFVSIKHCFGFRWRFRSTWSFDDVSICFPSSWRGGTEWGGPRRQVLVKCQFFLGQSSVGSAKSPGHDADWLTTQGAWKNASVGLRDTNIFKIKLDAFSNVYIYIHIHIHMHTIYTYLYTSSTAQGGGGSFRIGNL